MDFSGWVPPELKIILALVLIVSAFVGWHVGVFIASHFTLGFIW